MRLGLTLRQAPVLKLKLALLCVLCHHDIKNEDAEAVPFLGFGCRQANGYFTACPKCKYVFRVGPQYYDPIIQSRCRGYVDHDVLPEDATDDELLMLEDHEAAA